MPLFIQNKALVARKKNCSFRFLLSHSPSSLLICVFFLFHPSGAMIWGGEYEAVVLLGKAYVQSALGLFLVMLPVPLQLSVAWAVHGSCPGDATELPELCQIHGLWVKLHPLAFLFLTCRPGRSTLCFAQGAGIWTVSGECLRAMVLWRGNWEMLVPIGKCFLNKQTQFAHKYTAFQELRFQPWGFFTQHFYHLF